MSLLWWKIASGDEWGEYDDPRFHQRAQPPDITQPRGLRPTRQTPFVPTKSCECPGMWTEPGDPARPHVQELRHKMENHNFPLDYSDHMHGPGPCAECGGSDDDGPPSISLERGVHYQPVVHANGMVSVKGMHKSTYTDHWPYHPGDGNVHFMSDTANRICQVTHSDGIGYASDPDIAHKIEDHMKDPDVHKQLSDHMDNCDHFKKMMDEHANGPSPRPKMIPGASDHRPGWEERMAPGWEDHT
jgi:hypothetical protein